MKPAIMVCDGDGDVEDFNVVVGYAVYNDYAGIRAIAVTNRCVVCGRLGYWRASGHADVSAHGACRQSSQRVRRVRAARTEVDQGCENTKSRLLAGSTSAATEW